MCVWDACSGKTRVLIVKVEFMLSSILHHLIFLILLLGLGCLRWCHFLKNNFDALVVLVSRNWFDLWLQVLEEAVEGELVTLAFGSVTAAGICVVARALTSVSIAAAARSDADGRRRLNLLLLLIVWNAEINIGLEWKVRN